MSWLDKFLGRGEAAVTVPVFDGVLKPNDRLDAATQWLELDAPGDLAAGDGALWVADGNRVLRVSTETRHAEPVLNCDGPITALARVAGGLAVAIGGTRVEGHGGTLDGCVWREARGRPFVCVNALTVHGEGLIATDGSATQPPDAWQRDLMEKRREGRVLRLTPGNAEVLADGLSHAFGAVTAGEDVWVSESWAHRVRTLSGQIVLHDLPGYPSRLAPAADGGFWLSVFACRTQLVELILREKSFREEMLRTIPPQLWIAPQVKPPSSFLEPLQGGAIKQMGVLKPWAPPRSYGLVLKLSATGRVTRSLHSRVAGRHHGIVAIAEADGALWALSQGANALLKLDAEDTQ